MNVDISVNTDNIFVAMACKGKRKALSCT